MCGIAGLFPRDPAARPEGRRLAAMIDTLVHRGPDHQQVWTDAGVGLAHARLSILDLNPRSHQPMEDPETGTVLVYNGEIYNYIELREELRALGYTFRTESDTEVIPKAYRAWGVECLPRFNGMWAFALYDRRERKLFCARDRYGIKPFCYGLTEAGDLVFASEHKALWTCFPELAVPNGRLLARFLDEGVSASAYRETLYAGIFHLLPSHYFVVANGEAVEQVPYYRIPQEFQDPLPGMEEAARRYAELLEDAIRLRYRSDVPVGSCMSGGLDSSTLVGLATRMFRTRLHTFSCVYPDVPDVDESVYIEANVRHFDAEGFTITPRFDSFVDLVRRCTWEQDGPTAGPSIVSQRFVMQLARPRVRVLIDGQGADEVLGGYHIYFPFKLRTLARELVRSPSRVALREVREERRLQEARTGQRFRKEVHKGIRRALRGKPVRFGGGHGDLHSALDLQEPLPRDELGTYLLEHVRTNLVDLLHFEDRNSMAFSIETRLPFLDYRLVDHAFSLPHAYKIRGARTKLLLHDVAREVVPAKVYERPDKMGFSTPGQVWFRRAESVEAFDALFADPGLEVYAHVTARKREEMQRAWARCKAGEPISFGEECALWRLLTTDAWLRMLREGAPGEAAPPEGERWIPSVGEAEGEAAG